MNQPSKVLEGAFITSLSVGTVFRINALKARKDITRTEVDQLIMTMVLQRSVMDENGNPRWRSEEALLNEEARGFLEWCEPLLEEVMEASGIGSVGDDATSSQGGDLGNG